MEQISQSSPSQEFIAAKKNRTVHRAIATKQSNHIKSLIESEIPDSNEIQVSINILSEIKEKLIAFDDIIHSYLDEDSHVLDFEECIQRRGAVEKVILDAQRYLDKEKSADSHHSPDSRHSCCTNNFSGFKLPQLKLPTFEGDILEFRSFFDQYQAAVEGKGLTDVVKLQILLGCLKGSIKKSVSGYKLEARSYPLVVEYLKSLFDNPPKVVETLILKLLNLPSPTYSYKDLHFFKSEIQFLTQSLQSENVSKDCESCSIIMGTALTQKLPTVLRDKLNWQHPRTSWSLELLQTSLDQALSVLEAEGHHLTREEDRKSSPRPVSNQTRSKFNKNSSPKGNHVSTIYTVTQNHREVTRKHTCRFCDGEHYPSCCTRFPTLASRQALLHSKGWCSKCLSTRHQAQDCTIQLRDCFKCRTNGHHVALCPNNKGFIPQPQPINSNKNFHSSVTNQQPIPSQTNSSLPTTPSLDSRSEKGETNLSVNVSHSKKGVALPIADLEVVSHGRLHNVVALFDLGAQTTLISRAKSSQLNLNPLRHTEVSINGINQQGVTRTYEVVELLVCTTDGPIEIEALVMDPFPTQLFISGLVETTELLKEYKINLAYPEPSSNMIEDVGLLVGSDYLPKFITTTHNLNGIHLLGSKVGYLLWGTLPRGNLEPQAQIGLTSVLHVSSVHETEAEAALVLDPIPESSDEASQEADFSKLWDLTHIGISHEPFSVSERSALQTFENSVEFTDGKYTVSLPWKPNHQPLPDNYCLAKRRLYNNLKKLKTEPELLKAYHETIKDQQKRGFIEEVKPQQVHPHAKLHYLPHHGVQKQSSTTALRIVFDCSSNKPSLNNCLWSGPSLVSDLGKLLLSFRTKKYAISADIEKAFLGIRLAEKDRDSTRFLWLKDPTDFNSPLITYRFKAVLFGATCSPFLLAACLRKLIDSSQSPYKETLFPQFYVDNLYQTFDKETEISHFFHDVRNLLSQAGFNLREWTANSTMARSLFATHSLGTADINTRILGMSWDTSQDRMGYNQKPLNLEAHTKRLILKTLASVFDPLGILSPVTVKGKLLLQELWRDEVEWDQPISDELQKEWQSIHHELSMALLLTLPRQLIHSKKVELHAFSDASTKAYASVIYAVSNIETTAPTCHILMAKGRVAPKKEMTVPRLELMGLVLSARLLPYVVSALKETTSIDHLYCWTDSQVVLHWLSSNKTLPTFVQNRVDEIKRLLPHASWNHVPTKDNPCDPASRGTGAKYIFTDMWIHGPSWLTDKNSWPVWTESPHSVPCPIAVTSLTIHKEHLEPIIKVTRYSTLRHLLKVTCLVFRFISNLKAKYHDTPCSTTTVKPGFTSHNFSQEELNNAERFWEQRVQQEHFKKEIEVFKTKGLATNLMKQLNLCWIDGLLRCDRRLGNAFLSSESKFPVLLPHSHHYTVLLIHHYHIHYHHLSTNSLIPLMRHKYYFTRMRQTVKKTIRPCVLCKRLQGLAYRPTPAAALPASRVTETPPFTVVGIDYSGYFRVKVFDQTEKVYIALFTCAVTRAVHLEMVLDNSADSFLKALRRFSNRRGLPSIIYTDNATCFKSASSFLQTLFNHPSIKDYINQHRVSWRFNPSRASYFGGFFERLIGLTKTCLRRTLSKTLITCEEFYTVLTEVERTLNSRPLTYVSDSFESDEPLTPSHLLHGRDLQGLPYTEDSLDMDIPCEEHDTLSKAHKRLLLLSQNFWKRWKDEYLLSLRQKWSPHGVPQIAVGDIVLVESDGPRLTWKLGMIIHLHTAPDGVTRSVTLKTGTGEITRGVVHLYPLEIHSNLCGLSQKTHNSNILNTNSSTSSSTNQQDDILNRRVHLPPNERPDRTAKCEATEKIRLMSQYN